MLCSRSGLAILLRPLLFQRQGISPRSLIPAITRNVGIFREGGARELPAGTSFQPIQPQYLVTCVPQPGCNFSGLKRPLSRTKVTIEQLCNFFSRAWFSNLVQRSKDIAIEAAGRVWNLTHFRHSGLKVNLPRAAHSVFGPVESKNQR